jgi:hypothetical protein
VHNRRQDSFYDDSDTDAIGAAKSSSFSKSSASKSRPELCREDSQTSYENEEIIQKVKGQELQRQRDLEVQQKLLAEELAARQRDMEAKSKRAEALANAQQNLNLNSHTTPPKPQPQPRRSLSHDYENENTAAKLSYHRSKSNTDAKELSVSESQSQRSESPDPRDYVNTTMAPIPSYEEAIAGDLENNIAINTNSSEFFNMDDIEAPPVPTRADSHHQQVVLDVDDLPLPEVLPPDLATSDEVNTKYGHVTDKYQIRACYG